ncbi:hypothetical protein OAF37_02490 [Rubripirellula sp.]|nr:hypothetical protein [Rubripirellula sp.]MDB4644905.1 hypothetical protein [Rubripirellula sp.]
MLIITRKLSNETADIQKSQILITHGGEELLVTMRSGKGNSVSVGLHGPEFFKVDRVERARKGELDKAKDDSSGTVATSDYRFDTTNKDFGSHKDCFVRTTGSHWMAGKVHQIYMFGTKQYYNIETTDGGRMNGILAEDVHLILDSSNLVPNELESENTSV